jgi:membrane-bound serine protease (ClpP class)
VNYAGFALIALGIVLMMAELFMPSFGALGIGGVIAFVIGSIILLDTDAPGFGISRTLIGSVAFVGGSLVFALIWFAARSRTRPVVSGREAIIGAIAVAETDFTDDGVVRLQGEQWQAFSATPIRAGERVRVIGRDGLRLRVERVVSTEG